jgi:Protein of unknown function (DUF3592)/Protein of unknown function (DUF3738)
MAQMSNRGARLFCSLIIVIGLVAVGIGIWTLAKSIRTEYWPVTDGIVQSADMKASSGNHSRTTYSVKVTYSYQVVGADYTGDKVAIGQMSASSEYARGILNRYPVGKKVSVHYAPGDPSDAVLETGIHGGTWICLGVGTAFTLFGIMFLQISRAAARAQMPGAAESSAVKVWPDGRVTMDKPPVLMGVIFLLAGLGLGLIPPESGKPFWLMYAVGSVFFCGGVMLLLYRLDNKVYSKVATFVFLVPFLAIFNWISFGAGERNGTVNTPFSVTHGVDVRTPFAILTILLDVVIVAGLIHWLLKSPAGVTGSPGTAGQSMTQNKLKLMLMAGLVLLLALVAIFFAFPKKTLPTRPAAETPFVSTPIDDAFWLNLARCRPEKYRAQLKAAPPVLVVRESHYAFNSINRMHYGWMDNRLVNLHITFSELVADAYGKDYTHTEFPEAWNQGQWTNCYDVIVTVTNQPKKTLQSAEKKFLRQQYGLAWHLETRDTNVLVLRAIDPQLLQSKATRDFARSKSIPEFARELENYFGRPVIDETGATNCYDKTIGDVPSRWINGRSIDLDFNNQFLATVGLELVATNRPQEWLLMDR